MVQEIAKKLIRMGKKEAQGSLLYSSERGVPGFMRVGDGRGAVQSLPF